MIVIGIDPGITGAVAAIDEDGNYIDVRDIPVMAKGKGGSKVKNQVNAATLVNILKDFTYGGNRDLKAIVYLERVSAMPGQGVSSMFSMGDTFGVCRGVVAAMDIPIEIITPQSWKKYYGLGSDKEVCRAKAIELYPTAPLGRKKDHNRAEAILIARYGARMQAGGNYAINK